MTGFWDTLRRVRPALRDDLEQLVRLETDAIVEGLEQQPDPTDPDALAVAAERCRSRCLDELLSERFAGRAARAGGVERPDLQVLAFDLRQSAAALRFEPPEPFVQARTSILVLAAGIGALLGMMLGAWICVLLRIRPEGLETGRMVGALIGPPLAVLLVNYLTHHERLRRGIQWMLGILAVGVGAAEVLSWVNPVGRLWQLVTGRMHAVGRWARLKLLLLSVGLIVLLQLAKPVKRTTRAQRRRSVHAAIAYWLAAHLDLMTLLLVLQQGRTVSSTPPAGPAISSTPILESLRKLSSAGSVEERSDIAKEVLQECENAGLVFATGGQDGVFAESLQDAYDVVGLIDPGDPYRELEPPVREGQRVVVKGRITRKRDK